MRWGLLALSICACHHVREERCGTEQAELHRYRQSSEACQSGDLRACLVEAEWLERGGFFVRIDRERAAALRKRACEGGVGEGCGTVEATPVPPQTPPPVLVTSAPAEEPAPRTRRPEASVHVECLPNEVRFAGRSAQVFDDVAATLNDHPEITRLFLEGHASPDEPAPDALAQSRADAAVDELVRRHIDRARLVSSGSASGPLRGVTFRQGL
jgi:hypothetical protein